MGISSSVLQPQDLITFKKLPITVPLSEIQIPERAENRKPTNVRWLIAMGIFLLIFVPLMIYTLYYSDLRRILYGHDNCGNICGVKNCAWDGIPCSGKDFSINHLLKYGTDYHGANVESKSSRYPERNCVQSCGDRHIDSLGKCLELKRKYSDFNLPSEDNENRNIINGQVNYSIYFSHIKWQIIISCLLSILVAIGMMFLYRYAMALVVWSILILCLFGLCVTSVALWLASGSVNNGNSADVFRIFAICSTILTIVLIIIVLWGRNKIRLIILLFKEATRALFDMPMLIAVSVINVIIICFIAFIFVLLTICFISAGKLMLISADYYDYVKNPAMIVTIFYNVLAVIWIIQFFVGTQYMIISGAVLRWYFTRQKYGRFHEITESILVTVKYHLGTVALGSLINFIVITLKSIILLLCSNRLTRSCLNYYLRKLQNLVKLLSKNAYIITALHGQPFLKSGKRAATILLQNIGDIISINYIGNFVLYVCRLLIIIISILLGMLVFYLYPSTYYISEAEEDMPALMFIGLFAALVSYIIFQVFETTVDTLFISFCEDKLLNDGITREYFMSTNMFKFIEDSKKLYRKN